MKNDRGPSPLDAVTLSYLTILAGLTLVFRQGIETWWRWTALHAGAAALVLAIAFTLPRRPAGWRLAVRLWYPLALVPIAYRALESLVPAVHPRDYDRLLAAGDRAIFGVDPALWLEDFSSAWLTELMQLAYISFYLLPIALGVSLIRHRRYDEFEIAATVIVGGFFSSFLLYFVLPALGPRFLLAGSLGPLPSFESSAAIRDVLNSLEGVQRDAFPSGHAAVALICLGLARRYEKRLVVWMAPVVAAMLVSAVYLRYHYVLDLVAGAALALAALAAGAALDRRVNARSLLPAAPSS